jgi:hypothetical protein
MDRIFSARLDEVVVHRIGILAHRLHLPKKRVLERAVQVFSEQVEGMEKDDFLEQTFGAWRRREPAKVLVKKARAAFKRSMERRRRV